MHPENSKQRSVELGRAFVVALNEWDFEGLERILAPDATLEMPYAPEPIPQSISGGDAVISFFKTLPAVWDSANFHDIQVATVNDDPSYLVATYRADTIVKTSGLRYQNSYVTFLSIIGDRISTVREHYDPIQAIVATGNEVPPVTLP